MSDFFTFATMKILLQGAIGSLTFGMYHYYLTSKMMKKTTEKYLGNNNK